MRTHTLEDRMESFFLAETTKYLYLLFDPDNFIHNPGRTKYLYLLFDPENFIHNPGWTKYLYLLFFESLKTLEAVG